MVSGERGLRSSCPSIARNSSFLRSVSLRASCRARASVMSMLIPMSRSDPGSSAISRRAAGHPPGGAIAAAKAELVVVVPLPVAKKVLGMPLDAGPVVRMDRLAERRQIDRLVIRDPQHIPQPLGDREPGGGQVPIPGAGVGDLLGELQVVAVGRRKREDAGIRLPSDDKGVDFLLRCLRGSLLRLLQPLGQVRQLLPKLRILRRQRMLEEGTRCDSGAVMSAEKRALPGRSTPF